MSGDMWLSEYDACIRLSQDVMEKINDRNGQDKHSAGYNKMNAQVRSSMKQFSSKLAKIRESLIRSSTQYRIQCAVQLSNNVACFQSKNNTITQREVERRQSLLDELMTKEKQMEQAFKNENTHSRSSLMGSGKSGFSDPWGAGEEPEEYRDMSNDMVRDQQRQVIKEQDSGLDVLSSVISRQKQMAMDIGNEVDTQNEIIDDITDHTDRTSERLLKETRHVGIVDKKSRTCIFWVLIVLLFIAIIIIAAVPYNGKP